MSHDSSTAPLKGLMPLETRAALQIPTSEARNAASRLLSRMEGKTSELKNGLDQGPVTNPVERSRAVRLYPEAYAYLQALGVVVLPRKGDLPDDLAIQRPPSQAAVRRGVTRKKNAEKVPQALLERMVSALQLDHRPGQIPRFDVAFEDGQLGSLNCAIRLAPEGLMATFFAQDAHTARLLEAERHRLVAQLEAQGLRVAAVDIEMG